MCHLQYTLVRKKQRIVICIIILAYELKRLSKTKQLYILLLLELKSD